MFALASQFITNRAATVILLSLVLSLTLLFLPLSAYSQMPDEIFRLMQKMGRGEELTPAEDKRLNDWLAKPAKKGEEGPDTYKDAHGRFWAISLAGRLSIKCTERGNDSINETSQTFDLTFNTFNNGISPDWFATQKEMLRVAPAPLAYFGPNIEGKASLTEKRQTKSDSYRRECQAAIGHSESHIFLQEGLPEPVPLTMPEPPPVPLTKKSPPKRLGGNQPPTSVPAVFDGYGLLLVTLEYRCTEVRTDSDHTERTSDEFTDSFDIPVLVHVDGKQVTATLVRCDDQEEMEKQLRIVCPPAAQLGLGGTCRAFPGSKEIPCALGGELTGELTQIKNKP